MIICEKESSQGDLKQGTYRKHRVLILMHSIIYHDVLAALRCNPTLLQQRAGEGAAAKTATITGAVLVGVLPMRVVTSSPLESPGRGS